MPTPESPQAQAINLVNSIITQAENLQVFYAAMTTINQQWTDDAVANTLNAMGTVPLNTDGSLGTTPDGTPNPAHPFNPASYPGLLRSVSANQVASALTILQNVINYVNGQAVSATGGVHAILNNVTG